MRPKVLLIIPAYNEAENIPALVKEIVRFKGESALSYSLDYIVVNDGSTDEITALCRAEAIPCIDLPFNLGIGGAVQTGYIYADKLDYDIAVQFDGDGQHDIRFLPELLAPIIKGMADFTVGSRFLQKSDGFRSTRLRRVGIRILAGIICICSGLHITDPTSGFRAANREAMIYLSKEYPVDYPEPDSLVELANAGFRIADVAVQMRPREKGISSIGPFKSVYYMIKVSLAIVCKGFLRRYKK